MRRVSLIAPVLLALLAAALVVSAGGRATPAGGEVVSVVDGDTIVVDPAGGSPVTVRLLGIDTPETVDPDAPVECFGPEASAYAHRLLDGRAVELEYDRERHDRYGRLLAYVFVPGRSRLFANARLVERGFARTLEIVPNTAHSVELTTLEARAAVQGRGLWGACP